MIPTPRRLASWPNPCARTRNATAGYDEDLVAKDRVRVGKRDASCRRRGPDRTRRAVHQKVQAGIVGQPVLGRFAPTSGRRPRTTRAATLGLDRRSASRAASAACEADAGRCSETNRGCHRHLRKTLGRSAVRTITTSWSLRVPRCDSAPRRALPSPHWTETNAVDEKLGRDKRTSPTRIACLRVSHRVACAARSSPSAARRMTTGRRRNGSSALRHQRASRSRSI